MKVFSSLKPIADLVWCVGGGGGWGVSYIGYVRVM